MEIRPATATQFRVLRLDFRFKRLNSSSDSISITKYQRRMLSNWHERINSQTSLKEITQ